MAHYVFTVQFSDGKQLFGIGEDIGGWVCRQLFDTPGQARQVPRYGEGVDFSEPENAKATQQAVIILEWGDYPESPFKTRASHSAKWLTGPRDSDEIEAERPIDYGPYGAEPLKEVTQAIQFGAASVTLECPLCGAVAPRQAAEWPLINTDGVFIHSTNVPYGMACHACNRNFLFRPLTAE